MLHAKRPTPVRSDAHGERPRCPHAAHRTYVHARVDQVLEQPALVLRGRRGQECAEVGPDKEARIGGQARDAEAGQAGLEIPVRRGEALMIAAGKGVREESEERGYETCDWALGARLCGLCPGSWAGSGCGWVRPNPPGLVAVFMPIPKRARPCLVVGLEVARDPRLVLENVGQQMLRVAGHARKVRQLL